MPWGAHSPSPTAIMPRRVPAPCRNSRRRLRFKIAVPPQEGTPPRPFLRASRQRAWPGPVPPGTFTCAPPSSPAPAAAVTCPAGSAPARALPPQAAGRRGPGRGRKARPWGGVFPRGTRCELLPAQLLPLGRAFRKNK